jgi:4-phytase / acid phosphatase
MTHLPGYRSRVDANRGGRNSSVPDRLNLVLRWSIFFSTALTFVPAAPTQPKPILRYVAIVSRHGVRAPSATLDQLRTFSAAAWPDFGAPPSHLTPHGDQLMRQLGTWYRDWLGGEHVLSDSGCSESDRIWFHADSDQRTRATAVALAAGLLPGCRIDPHALPEDENDPLFNPFASGLVKPDSGRALADVLARASGSTEALAARYRSEFAELDRILGRPLPAAPIAIVAGRGDNPVDVTGPLRTASTLTENLLLEYCNGIRGADLGWGRLTAANLRQVMTLHTAYAHLVRRTPYIARLRGSNLLAHVLASLRQASSAKPVTGAIGPPGARAVILVGHDTNLSNLSGMLGLNWTLPDYAPDDTPPGGALVFELWQTGESFSVRSSYVVQSLLQMQEARPLTARNPQLRATLRLQGCGRDYCEWTAFQEALEAAIDRSAVR